MTEIVTHHFDKIPGIHEDDVAEYLRDHCISCHVSSWLGKYIITTPENESAALRVFMESLPDYLSCVR